MTKERRQHLNSICASHVKGTPDPSRFDAWDQRLSQDLKTNSFLVDHKRRLLYCYNHKVKPAETKMFSRIPLINHLSNVCLWLLMFAQFSRLPLILLLAGFQGCLQLLDVNLYQAGDWEGPWSREQPARPSGFKHIQITYMYMNIYINDFPKLAFRIQIRNQMAPHTHKELLDAAKNYTNILLVR